MGGASRGMGCVLSEELRQCVLSDKEKWRERVELGPILGVPQHPAHESKDLNDVKITLIRATNLKCDLSSVGIKDVDGLRGDTSWSQLKPGGDYQWTVDGYKFNYKLCAFKFEVVDANKKSCGKAKVPIHQFYGQAQVG